MLSETLVIHTGISTYYYAATYSVFYMRRRIIIYRKMGISIEWTGSSDIEWIGSSNIDWIGSSNIEWIGCSGIEWIGNSGTNWTAVVKLSELNFSYVLNRLSLYPHKALYVHPKASNGDSKVLDIHPKPLNESIKQASPVILIFAMFTRIHPVQSPFWTGSKGDLCYLKWTYTG